jgi:hypothetical protein
MSRFDTRGRRRLLRQMVTRRCQKCGGNGRVSLGASGPIECPGYYGCGREPKGLGLAILDLLRIYLSPFIREAMKRAACPARAGWRPSAVSPAGPRCFEHRRLRSCRAGTSPRTRCILRVAESRRQGGAGIDRAVPRTPWTAVRTSACEPGILASSHAIYIGHAVSGVPIGSRCRGVPAKARRVRRGRIGVL